MDTINSKKIKQIVKWFKEKNHEETRNHFIDGDENSVKGHIRFILIREYPTKSINEINELIELIFKHGWKKYQPEIPKTIPNVFADVTAINRAKERKELKKKLKHRRR